MIQDVQVIGDMPQAVAWGTHQHPFHHISHLVYLDTTPHQPKRWMARCSVTIQP